MTWFLWLVLAQSLALAQSKDAIEKQRAAAAIQREAVSKQAEMAARLFDAEPAPEPADCDAIPDPYASVMIGFAAGRQHLDPKLLRALIVRESGFRPCAVSPKGARGLMQLMPATIEQFQVSDAFDAGQNIEAGAKYLRQLLDRYKGDVSLALAAYNAGPGAVDAAGGVPDIAETRDYVKAILGAKPPAPPQSPTPKPTGN